MKQNMCGAPCATTMNATVELCDGDQLVSAGDVCGSDCAGFADAPDGAVQAIQVYAQVYRAGYCPAEALRMGTLFPELASPYTRGC